MRRAAGDCLNRIVSCLSEKRASWKARHPRLVLEQRAERLRQFQVLYLQLAKHRLEGMDQRMERARRLLRTLGPESAFERGFSITLTAQGDLVTDPEQVKPGDRLTTRVAGGRIQSEVAGE